MHKVFVTYNLKPGVDVEDYKRWSRSRDQATTPFVDGVIRFEVYEVRGAEKGQPPYRIVEDIEVESWEAWQKALQGPAMAPIVKEWDQFGDGGSVVMLWAEKI